MIMIGSFWTSRCWLIRTAICLVAAANQSKEALPAGLRLGRLGLYIAIWHQLYVRTIELFRFGVYFFGLSFKGFHEECAKSLLTFAVLLELFAIHFIESKGKAGNVQGHNLLRIRKFAWGPSEDFAVNLFFELSKHIHNRIEKRPLLFLECFF